VPSVSPHLVHGNFNNQEITTKARILARRQKAHSKSETLPRLLPLPTPHPCQPRCRATRAESTRRGRPPSRSRTESTAAGLRVRYGSMGAEQKPVLDDPKADVRESPGGSARQGPAATRLARRTGVASSAPEPTRPASPLRRMRRRTRPPCVAPPEDHKAGSSENRGTKPSAQRNCLEA